MQLQSVQEITDCTFKGRVSIVFRKKKINFKYQHKEENKTEKSLKTTHDISQTGFYKPNAGKNHSNYDDDKNDDEKD